MNWGSFVGHSEIDGIVLSFVVANFIHDINRGLQYDKEPVSSPKLSQSENDLYIDKLNQFDGLYIKSCILWTVY